jgi:septal ring factor EnvC (AmiA/AmiB activator)
MSANELADKLENWRSPDDLKQAATMLRQQQAEIEALTTQFVRVADENNRLKDKIEMLTKGKVEYGYDTTKTS